MTEKLSNRTKNVLIAGSGQMACAMSSLLVRNGHNITILCREPEEAQQINSDKSIIFHSDMLSKTISLPGVTAFTYKEIGTLSNNFEYILLAVPTEAIRDVLEKIKPILEKNKRCIIIGTSKSIKNGLLPHQIVQQSLRRYSFDYVCVSGPGFAEGIIQKEITTVNVAAERERAAMLVYSLLKTPFFILEYSKDVKGIELLGALKNEAAIIAGICDGLIGTELDIDGDTFRTGPNTKACLLKYVGDDCRKVLVHQGCDTQTMEEVARWDIEMCSMMLSPSRNYKTGWRLSKGEALETIVDDFKTVEGIGTAKGLKDTLGEYFWELPLFSNLYLVLYEGKSLEQAIVDILNSYLENPLPQ